MLLVYYLLRDQIYSTFPWCVWVQGNLFTPSVPSRVEVIICKMKEHRLQNSWMVVSMSK